MFNCVITSGYYTGACIDYVTPCDTIVSNAIEYAMYDDISVDEIFAQLRDEYNISRYRFNKCFGLRNPLTTNLWDYIENGCDKLQEWLCDQERSKADEILNEIKKMFGYDEYYCAGVFSNGEAIYYKK